MKSHVKGKHHTTQIFGNKDNYNITKCCLYLYKKEETNLICKDKICYKKTKSLCDFFREIKDHNLHQSFGSIQWSN